MTASHAHQAPDDIDEAAEGGAFDRFILGHWGKRPGLARHLLDRPPCTPDDMLEIVSGLSAVIGVGAAVGARFYVDGLQVPPQHPLERAFMRDPAERSLAAYVEGVTARLSGRTFCLVIDDAALLNPAVWQRMKQLAARVVRHVGYPTGRIEYNAFIGTCPITPFGIHFDTAHTLTVQAGGSGKTMLTWPRGRLEPPRGGSRFTKDPDRIDALAAQAERWRLQSGTDLLYMPAGCWHVSRKDEDCPFQASLALGFTLEETPAADLSELVARELKAVLDKRLAGRALDPERAGGIEPEGGHAPRSGLSTQNALALAVAREALARDGGVMEAVEAALKRRTIRRLSGLVESTRTRDLEPVFPVIAGSSPLQPTAKVRLLAHPLSATIAGRRTISINGALFEPEEPAGPLAAALRVLGNGGEASVEALTRNDSGDVMRFLGIAWAAGALAIDA